MIIANKEHYLKLALMGFGVVFCFVYPLGYLWPSGWVGHGGEGYYYLQMISGVYAVLGIFLLCRGEKSAGTPQPHSVHHLVEHCFMGASWRCRRWEITMSAAILSVMCQRSLSQRVSSGFCCRQGQDDTRQRLC